VQQCHCIFIAHRMVQIQLDPHLKWIFKNDRISGWIWIWIWWRSHRGGDTGARCLLEAYLVIQISVKMHLNTLFLPKKFKIFLLRGTTHSSDPFPIGEQTPISTPHFQMPPYIQILAAPLKPTPAWVGCCNDHVSQTVGGLSTDRLCGHVLALVLTVHIKSTRHF